MAIRFHSLTHRTGTYSQLLKVDMDQQTSENRIVSETILNKPADKGRIYLALLPPDLPWLLVKASWYADGDENHNFPFTTAPEMVRKMFDIEGPSIGRHLLGAVSKNASVLIDVTINTDHPTFIQMPAKPTQLSLNVKSAVFVNEQIYPSQTEILIEVSNIIEIADYTGYVAIDLGNTGSTMVRRDGLHSTDTSMHLVDLEKPYNNPNPAASPSAIWLSSYKETEPVDQNYPIVNYEVGRSAASANRPPQELLFGAKRLLSDRTTSDDNQKIVIEINGVSHNIPRYVPAELFISRMLVAFARNQKSIPQRLVLTCPTTFNRTEVEELKRAAYHAYRRFMGETIRTEPTQAEVNRIIWRVIDEASAAAFYFVYKDFLRREVPGRIPGFQYLYPDGLTLLLYDCGGGTTDLALVRVTANETNKIDFKVLGRAGHRMFGGDAMTIAVFRILKAKIAQKIFPNLISPNFDAATFWSKPDAVITLDQEFRNAFGGENLNELNESQKLELDKRRSRTMLLWQMAERIKMKIAATASFKDAVKIFDCGNLGDWSMFTQTFGWEKLSNKLEEITISRSEVDPLLLKDLRETVIYAKNLLAKRLEPDREVDCVYVVGNASKYGLVTETLTDRDQGLPIRFLKQRIQKVEEADLKNAVAKGALIAMQVSLMHDDNFSVDFDDNLMDRLSFDVKRVGVDTAMDKLLFSENTHYNDLGVRRINVINRESGVGGGTGLTVRRAWPGDQKDEPFLWFDLGDRKYDSYEISFSETHDKQDRRRFVLRPYDEETAATLNDEIVGYSTEAGLQNSPVELGEKRWPLANILEITKKTRN